jgi:hypothetical protein
METLKSVAKLLCSLPLVIVLLVCIFVQSMTCALLKWMTGIDYNI